jgi:integrase
MALPKFFTKKEIEWVFKVTEKQSPWPKRDLCLLAFFFGSPCFILELNKITISDVLSGGDMINKSFIIRGDKAMNGEHRMFFIKPPITELLNKYIRSIPDLYSNEFLFRTLKGEAFSITESKGYYNPVSLTRHILNLLRESGIESPSALSGRRTFATEANRNGIPVHVIHHLLGNIALVTTKRFINNDPAIMGAITEKAY